MTVAVLPRPAPPAGHCYVEDLHPHPEADLVPRQRPEEWDAFLADVRAHGVQEPVVATPEGVLLDGRHRWEASRECGHQALPVRRLAIPPEAQLLYIIDAALLRRHLGPDQTAALAVEKVKLLEAERATEQRRQAGRAPRPGRRANGDTKVVSPLGVAPPPKAPKAPKTPPSTTVVAKTAGVSRQRVQRAKRLKDTAPQEFEAVKRGTKTLAQAEQAHVQTTERTLLTAAGIEDSPAVTRAKLRREWAAIEAHGRKHLLGLAAPAVIAVLDLPERATAARYVADCRAWFKAFDAALKAGARPARVE